MWLQQKILLDWQTPESFILLSLNNANHIYEHTQTHTCTSIPQSFVPQHQPSRAVYWWGQRSGPPHSAGLSSLRPPALCCRSYRGAAGERETVNRTQPGKMQIRWLWCIMSAATLVSQVSKRCSSGGRYFSQAVCNKQAPPESLLSHPWFPLVIGL